MGGVAVIDNYSESESESEKFESSIARRQKLIGKMYVSAIYLSNYLKIVNGFGSFF